MNYCVENRQQLPHRGHEGDHRGFTGGAQALIVRPDDRVPARRHQGCHLVRERLGNCPTHPHFRWDQGRAR